MKLLNWLFGAPEEINGRNRCPTYLYRWPIIKRTSGFAMYIHHFVGDDWSLDLHDHPKRFISIGLKGAYLETTPEGQRWYRAPWIRSFSAYHIHRLETPSRNCWTLCIVLRTEREWGFWHESCWVPWKAFVNSPDADRRKSCPD